MKNPGIHAKRMGVEFSPKHLVRRTTIAVHTTGSIEVCRKRSHRACQNQKNRDRHRDAKLLGGASKILESHISPGWRFRRLESRSENLAWETQGAEHFRTHHPGTEDGSPTRWIVLAAHDLGTSGLFEIRIREFADSLSSISQNLTLILRVRR